MKMCYCTKLLAGLGMAAGLLATTLAAHASPPLTAGQPIALPGVRGGFDFIHVDAAANRLLLDQEKGNTAFVVFDLRARKLLKRVPTGTTQDVSVDLKRDRYYISGNDPGRLLIVDRKTLSILGTLPRPTPTNLNGYDPANGMVYLTSDSTPRIWVIDPATRKIAATITLKGTGMQGLVFAPHDAAIYQALKNPASISVIDPATNKITHVWPVPGLMPHGIEVVPGSGDLLVACYDGTLLLMDPANGKILSRAKIAPDVDQIAFDPANHLVYCASKDGQISVARLSGITLTALGSVPDEKTTHSITVDPKTHTVWIGYAKNGQSYVQPFTPAR